MIFPRKTKVYQPIGDQLVVILWEGGWREGPATFQPMTQPRILRSFVDVAKTLFRKIT